MIHSMRGRLENKTNKKKKKKNGKKSKSRGFQFNRMNIVPRSLEKFGLGSVSGEWLAGWLVVARQRRLVAFLEAGTNPLLSHY